MYAPVAGVETCAWPFTSCYEEATDEVTRGEHAVAFCAGHARAVTELYDDAELASRGS